MKMQSLVKSWTYPDRSTERTQITLRLPFTDYARLHALKQVYQNRSVNDLLTDIIRVGLDEIVEALPTYSADEEEVAIRNDRLGDGLPASCYFQVGDSIGPAVDFDNNLRQILNSKSDESSDQPS